MYFQVMYITTSIACFNLTEESFFVFIVVLKVASS
jgi:hypothetical protein